MEQLPLSQEMSRWSLQSIISYVVLPAFAAVIVVGVLVWSGGVGPFLGIITNFFTPTANGLPDTYPADRGSLIIQRVTDIHALLGTIEQVGPSSFVIMVDPRSSNEDASFALRTVAVNVNTVISERSGQKDAATYAAEIKAFEETQAALLKSTSASAQTQKATLMAPDLYTYATSTFASLKRGQTVAVSAIDNIHSVKEFTAASVRILINP